MYASPLSHKGGSPHVRYTRYMFPLLLHGLTIFLYTHSQPRGMIVAKYVYLCVILNFLYKNHLSQQPT